VEGDEGSVRVGVITMVAKGGFSNHPETGVQNDLEKNTGLDGENDLYKEKSCLLLKKRGGCH